MRRSIVITKAATPAAVDNGSVGLTGVAGALSAGSVAVSGAAWNLPATISVQQDGTVGLRQYALNAGAHTISVSGLPTGVTYNSGLERLEGAATGASSGTATFTLTRVGGSDVVDTATVALVDQLIHDFTGLPLTADGWTDLDAMMLSADYASSRFVYVSNAGGAGQVYTQAQVNALGGTPTNPATAPNAYSSYSAAWEQVRNGFADVILFRRGDTFSGTLSVNKSGPSNTGRLIVAAYGPLTTDRPIASAVPAGGVANTIIADLQFSGSDARFFAGSNGLLEGCFIAGPEGAGDTIFTMLNGGSSANGPGGGTVRRNAGTWSQWFAGDWGDAAQTPSRFEENSIARTLHVSVTGNFKSTVYFAEGARNIQSIRNQTLLTGNAGFRQRDGGLVRENLTLGTQELLTWGGGYDLMGDITAERNVSLNSHGPHDFTALQSAHFNGNIFTDFSAPEQGIARLVGDYPSNASGVIGGWTGNTVFENNIYRNGGETFGQRAGENFLDVFAPGATVTFRNEYFVKTNSQPVMSVFTDGRVIYESNNYFSNAAQAGWFSGRTYAEMVPSTGQAFDPTTWPDPDRGILSYMQSLGANPASADQAAEWYTDGVPGNPSLAGALANRKGAWDERFTARAVINYIRAGFGLGEI